MTKKQALEVKDSEPVSDTVSIEEAKNIFSERSDVAAVLTTEGTLHRDGHIT